MIEYIHPGEIVGRLVIHQKFGNGVISSIENEIITIQFLSGQKRFILPDAFFAYLTSYDVDVWKYLNFNYPDNRFEHQIHQARFESDFSEFEICNYQLIQYRKNAPYVRVPDGVTSIADNAFSKKSLEKLFIPASVVSIPAHRLHPSSLREIIVDEGNPLFASMDGCLYTKDFTKLLICPSRKTSIEFPGSLREIGDCAFEGVTCISKLTIPEGVEKLGKHLFNVECIHSALSLPSTVKYWDDESLEAFVCHGEFGYCETTVFDTFFVPEHLFLSFSNNPRLSKARVKLNTSIHQDEDTQTNMLMLSDRSAVILRQKGLYDFDFQSITIDSLFDTVKDYECVREVAILLHARGYHFNKCKCINYRSVAQYVDDYCESEDSNTDWEWS